MKNFFVLLCALATAYTASAQNQLTKKEQQQGYHLLFDGKSTSGWHTYLKSTPGEAWKVTDGALTLDPKAPNQGDLVTDKEYENYELSVDWKISPEGNSGVIFGVHEDTTLKQTYLSGIEMQVLDNEKAEDNKKANHVAGSLYDMKAPAVSAAKPAGQWNTAKISKNAGHLMFWLNGKEVINVQMGSPEWQELINKSKFKNWQSFAKYPKGRLALQDHDHVVAFKNLKIKEL